MCSKLTISKETPFYNLNKVFKSAVDYGRMPDGTGQLMEELGLRLKGSSGAYARFFQWANSGAERTAPYLSCQPDGS